MHNNDRDLLRVNSEPSFLKRVSDGVVTGIAHAFRVWGRLVAKYPYSVISVTAIFALLWAFAFVAQLKVELDGEDLYTPSDAESFEAKRYVDRVYGSYRARARVFSVRNPDLVNENDPESRLLLKDADTARESIQEYFQVYKEVRDFEVTYEGEQYTLNDLCIRPSEGAPCLVKSILDLWAYNEDVIMAADFNPLEDINADQPLLDRFGLPLSVDIHLGKKKGDECKKEKETSRNVEVFAMTIIYINEKEEVNGAEIDPRSLKWIEGLVNHVIETSKSMSLDTYIADANAVEKAADKQVQEDIQLLSIGFLLVMVYTNVVLFKNSCISCKMHLSVVSIIGIVFALFSAFGIGQTIGLKMNPVVQVLPFLIFGLGIDDTYIIVGAYQKLKQDLPVEEKILLTLEKAGSSILVTSATDCCAFLVGFFTRLPAMRAFSVYAALAILFDFLFQVTFFVAFLVIEARREARYRNGSSYYGVTACCKGDPYDETAAADHPPGEQEIRAMGSLDVESQEKETEETTASPVNNPSVWRKMCGDGDYNPSIPTFATKLAGTYIPAVTLHPAGRMGVIVAECALVAAAIYGCTKVSMDFKYIEWMTPKGSSYEVAYSLEKEYFKGNQRSFGVYTQEATDGDYFYHQGELAALKSTLDHDPYVFSPVHTWYEGYVEWLQAESDYADQLVNGSAPNADSFNAWLQEYLSGPGAVFKGDVVFSDESKPHVISSKIDALTVEITGGKQAVSLVDSIRSSIESAAPSLDPITYSYSFLFYDGFRIITWETIRNLLMAAAGVFIVNVIILASFQTAVIVISMVGLTDLVVIGYMWYVDQYFNPVTAVNLVLVVGIAVDYSAHIAHSFLALPGDRQTRAKGALEQIGGEVISGALTTWLGISVLVLAGHYFFRSFFVMFFAIIVVGAWHGLIVLPVVLSFIGADSYPSEH